jgi:thiol-disulfide isomerase/thioredoxin
MSRQAKSRQLRVALVAAVLAGLVAALVLSFVLEDDEPEDAVADLTIAPSDDTAPQVDLTGDPVPEFSYQPLGEGEDVDFETFRDGRPAVINFFGAWCVPCVQEMPDFEDAHQEYGDRVAFLGLSSRESVEDGLELVDRTGVTYETGRDADGSIVSAFSAVNLPTTIFVRADGTIQVSHTGRVYPDEIREELEALVA